MVFFSCNSCGESLKKNQVEKHCQFKCRQCQVLSCVDCGKEFWGEDYKQHIKCMTEEEKYSGKNYQPKANANKGEKKQLAWCEQVQQAIDATAGSNHKLRSVLERLRDCPNVPRKRKKFENFAKSSLRVFDQKLLDQAWEAINSGSQQSNGQQESKTSQGNPNACQADAPKDTSAETSDSQNNTAESEKEHKLSKRERKEERRKQKQKLEKKDKKTQLDGEEVKQHKKKATKRKHEVEEEEEEEEENGKEEEEGSRKKKKKRKNKEKEDTEPEDEAQPSPKKKKKKQKDVPEAEQMEEDEEEEQAEPAGKFQWEAVIIQALTAASDKELSIKRLKKKVIAEYHARDRGGQKQLPEEKLWAKFKKKVTKNPRLKVLKDRVKLVH